MFWQFYAKHNIAYMLVASVNSMGTPFRPFTKGLVMALTYLLVQLLHPFIIILTVHIDITELHKHKILFQHD